MIPAALFTFLIAFILCVLAALAIRYLSDRYAKHRDLQRDANLWREAQAKRRYEIDEMSLRAIADFRRDEIAKRQQRADYERMCKSVVNAVNEEARRNPVVRELATVLTFRHPTGRAVRFESNEGESA